MSATARDAMIEALKASSLEQAKVQLATGKVLFIETFKSYLDPKDVIALDDIVQGMIGAKTRQWGATTEDEARFAQDEYQASKNAIETLFLRYEVVGKAKLGKFASSMAHSLVSGAFAVAGAVLQVGLGVLFPVVGSLAGAALNVGIQHVVKYFQGD